MRKKKRGAALIVVIIIFMFISSVSVAMLSMISANYKARVSESKRVENLYSSESGLNIAYNIMVKTFDAATTYGYYEVEALKKGNPTSINNLKYIDIQAYIAELRRKIEESENRIKELRASDEDNRDKIKDENRKIQEYNELIDECNKMIDTLLKEEFKRAFKYFIKKPNNLEEYEVSPNKLESSVSDKRYVNKVSSISNFQTLKVDIPNTTEQTDESGKKEEFPKLSAKVELKNTTEESKKKHVSMELKLDSGSKEVTIDIIENDKYEITLQSIFQSTKEKTNTEVVGYNKKTVQAKYNIYVPEYSDIFFGQGNDNISEYVVLENKALMVGKEMKVNDVDKLTVTGDVFVEGDAESEGESDSFNSIDARTRIRTYEKYNGGIRINYENGSKKEKSSSDNVIFKNDVITRGTFNLQNNMKVNIEGDLYALNLYAGKISATGYSEGSILNANNVILDNDLTVKANETHIGMNNFYGINDKNTKFDSGTKQYYNTNVDAAKERTSSSIIVNSQESNSTVRISDTGEAYIMGVAHINTNDGYQTGESVAVKGNYAAYAIPIDKDETFKYDDPLQVVEDEDENVFNKANHFSRYWNKVMNGEEWEGIDDVGRSIKKTGEIPKTAGGIFLPSKIYSTGAIVYKNGTETVVKPSQYTIDGVEEKIKDKREAYAGKVYRMGEESNIGDYNLLGRYPDKVEDLINFSGISDYNMSEELEALEDNNNKEVAIFNPDSSIAIEIDGSKMTVGEEEYTIGSTIKAVIVTAGDVTIKGDNGDVNFNGNIITCGNLNIESGNIQIKYDEEIVNRIKLKYEKLFENVFENIATKESAESNSTKEVKLEDIKSQYDIGKFLENKLWKIPKVGDEI